MINRASMKPGFNLGLALAAFLASVMLANRPAHAQLWSPYFSFGVGGDFKIGGGPYDNRDPRFQFQLEGGTRFFAFPVSFSKGQDILILGFKPRAQYLFAPFRGLENFEMGPGFGLVLNYWHADAGLFVPGSFDIEVLEIGNQISFHFRYQLHPNFHIHFMPIALDINYWRRTWIDGPTISAADSKVEAGVIYNFLLSLGFNF